MVAKKWELNYDSNNLTEHIKHKNMLSTTLQRSNEFLKSSFQQGTW